MAVPSPLGGQTQPPPKEPRPGPEPPRSLRRAAPAMDKITAAPLLPRGNLHCRPRRAPSITPGHRIHG